MFTVAAMPAFVAAKMWVIDKSTALAGGALTVTVFSPGFDHAGGAFGTTLKPALTYSAAVPTLYIVDNAGFSSGGTPLVRLSQITGTGPAPVWSVVPGSLFAGTGLFFVANSFDFTQLAAPQAGTATTVLTGDFRASDSVFRNGKLWFAHSGGLPVGAVDRTAVFWYQLDPTAMPTPIVQSGVFDGGTGVHQFFPSITANAANDALIGFSRSDATKFVEAVTAGRFGGDLLGTMMAPTVLKTGEGCYFKTFGAGNNRWGDYSATSIDPTDDLTFWTVQEYAATPSPAASCADGSGRWGTWWGTTEAVSTTTTTTTTTSTTTTPSSTTTTTTTSTTLAPLCAAVPAVGCRLAAPGAASVLLKANAVPAKDQFKWKWAKGAATAVTDFKDPVGGSATYRVCVYDGSARPQPLMEMDVLPGGTCGTKPCWKASGTTGFSFANKVGTTTGLTSMKLKAGSAGKAQVQAAGKGASLPMPTLGLTLPVTVQFLAKDALSTECWQTAFTTQTTNDTARFSAKGP
jgi:hypothetical protein